MSDRAEAMKTREKEANTEKNDQENQQTTVDLSAYIQPHNTEAGVPSFVIEDHERNTSDNPNREGTSTFPVLVRRVNSEELLPRPFKTTNQLLCVSYLSFFFCCCLFSAFAITRAWKTKQKRGQGLFSSAINDGKCACHWLKAALAVGICGYIVGIVFLILYLAGVPV